MKLGCSFAAVKRAFRIESHQLRESSSPSSFPWRRLRKEPQGKCIQNAATECRAKSSTSTNRLLSAPSKLALSIKRHSAAASRASRPPLRLTGRSQPAHRCAAHYVPALCSLCNWIRCRRRPPHPTNPPTPPLSHDAFDCLREASNKSRDQSVSKRVGTLSRPAPLSNKRRSNRCRKNI